MIIVKCKVCGKKYQVKKESLGKNLTCKVCGGGLTLPPEAKQAATSPPSPAQQTDSSQQQKRPGKFQTRPQPKEDVDNMEKLEILDSLDQFPGVLEQAKKMEKKQEEVKNIEPLFEHADLKEERDASGFDPHGSDVVLDGYKSLAQRIMEKKKKMPRVFPFRLKISLALGGITTIIGVIMIIQVMVNAKGKTITDLIASAQLMPEFIVIVFSALIFIAILSFQMNMLTLVRRLLIVGTLAALGFGIYSVIASDPIRGAGAILAGIIWGTVIGLTAGENVRSFIEVKEDEKKGIV